MKSRSGVCLAGSIQVRSGHVSSKTRTALVLARKKWFDSVALVLQRTAFFLSLLPQGIVEEAFPSELLSLFLQ